MKILDVVIRRPIFTLMMTVALLVFGMFSYGKVGVELFPNVEFPMVTVQAVYPGADPESMEQKVAKPIEDALSSMSGIKVLASSNLESATLVFVQFELNVDRDKATQDIRDRISAIEAKLPENVDIKVQKLDIGAVPIMSVALSGDMSTRELTELADDVVKDRLQRIQGVGNVDIVGGRAREVHVTLDLAKLEASGLTPAEVAMALQGQNLELPAGLIEEHGTEWVLTTKGAFTTPQQIADAPIASTPAGVVRIGDVATKIDVTAAAEQRSHASRDGESAVGVIVQKQSGTNSLAVAEAVHAELDAIREMWAEQGIDADLTVTHDQAPFIERSFEEVRFDLLLGGLLAIVIVLGFLHDWRATFISAMALPTSVIATVWFLSLLGFTFNMMTMLALSLSIGLLIDDAIVVIENIHRHLELGKSPMDAASDATREIALAVIATTASIVAVFLPVATMKGMVGKFFFQFGITVSIAVAVSLFVSLTLTPMLAARLLKTAHGKPGFVVRGIEWFLGILERIYRRIITFALRQRAVTLIAAVLVSAGSCMLAAQVKSEFLPPEDRSQFTIDVELPTGTSLKRSVEVLEAIATDVRANAPGVTATFVTIGGGAQGQVNIGKVQANLVRPSKRGFKQQELMAWARERYKPLEERGLKIAVNEVNEMGGDSGFKNQAVQFALRSNDMPRLIEAAEALKQELHEMGGFIDIDSTYRGGKPQIQIEPDRRVAAEVGVPVASIATTLRSVVAGDMVTEYKDGVDLYEVKLQLPAEAEARLASLSNLNVRSTSGQLVPLSSVVKVERGLGPSQIDRQSRTRQITILANLDGITLGEATTRLEQAAAKVVPKDIVAEDIGMGKMMAESFGYMFTALALAIVLVYMVLAAQFNSLIHPITIMMSLVFAPIGAFAALFIAGQTMSIFSMIGLIMLMGLVTKNAILVVDFANKRKEAGLATREALIEAGTIRLRPILMTTAAMILGMLPVALALGEGGEQRAPMAVVVIGGLLTSTALTLVVVPVVYSIFEGIKDRFRRWFGPKGPPPAKVVVIEAE